MHRDQVEEVLLKYVQGLVPIAALNSVGILTSFEQNPESVVIKIISEVPLTISPTASDMVQGLVNVTPGRDLKEWASFIMATDLIELDEVDRHPQSDELINVLWDASFTGHVDETVLNQLIASTSLKKE